MPLHPILALDHVIDEYRDHLCTAFRAKDPGLRAALEQALDEPRFLAQEPFFQAHRPFRSGKRWRELPLDPKLAQAMEERAAGFSGVVSVRRYDRGTAQEERVEMRQNPPHILLTNYMMLEYLLVRPADREDIFANHRCRFLVLDEVHTYRGTLGSHIALLVRRLRVHLAQARQDWYPNVPEADRARRYPALVPVGTSATIKSLAGAVQSRDEALRQRDAAVQEFFSKLTGVEASSIRILGEEIEATPAPPEARYPAVPAAPGPVHIADPENVRVALCALAGVASTTPLTEPARRCRLLWDLNRWLTGAPLSISRLIEQLRSEVPARQSARDAALHREVEAALLVGAALPDGVPGALRLRAQRFIRGGWRFHRCVHPACGRLYPMGEERCGCGHATAPLYLCRNCGADYLRLVGNPAEGPLRPGSNTSEGPERMLYEHGRFAVSDTDEEFEAEEDADASPETLTTRPRGGRQVPAQMKQLPVLHGSFDPATLAFSADATAYPMQVTLAPARTRCLCCGGTAGSRNVITPVSLGTSAALKVLTEGLLEALDAANRDRPDHDAKEPLLIFSDSRQDAAHQARFLLFASRYDRMRRTLVRLLDQHGPLSVQRAVELLGEAGVHAQDNPHAPTDHEAWIPEEMLQRIRAWEEAPLLDDLAITAGYRASLLNLGLVGVRYHQLDGYVRARGNDLATMLGIPLDALEYLGRCLLDEMRTRGALSRQMLRYHPAHPACPAHIKAAEGERRVKQPGGYAAARDGRPMAYLKCHSCALRFRADHPRCPRCGDDTPGSALPAAEFAGFLARRDESPVRDEEDRYTVRNLVRS
jgi:hypothetical protein